MQFFPALYSLDSVKFSGISFNSDDTKGRWIYKAINDGVYRLDLNSYCLSSDILPNTFAEPKDNINVFITI